MAKITWLQIFATVFQLITSTSGTCNETNVGIRDELKVIPDGQMTASSINGSDFLPAFGRLQGMKAWCPNISDAGPVYLQIDLAQKYVICGVEAQGLPGASVTSSFTLSFSNDGSTFTDFNSNQQFNGSGANGDISDFHELSPTETAQYIRFKPVSTSICLRVEVYGTPEGVEVTCNQNDIQVQINRSVHAGLDPNDLHLIDKQCLPSSSNGSFINFNIALGTCGTLVVFSNDGVKSFYRNEIINNATNTTEFDIICSYIREPTQLGTDTGSFIFSMAIFTDENFTTPITSGSKIALRTDLFFKIEVETTDEDVDLHLRKCRATNSNDPDDLGGYIFIEKGCQTPNDSFVSGYNCNKTTTSQHFVLSVFRFAGSAPGESIFIHCDVVLCLISTIDSTCTTECAACTSGMRKKRALEDHSRKYLAEKHLVLGPYKIIDNPDEGNNGGEDERGGQTEREDPSEAITDSENFPFTMVIIICVSSLVVIAVVIGLLVMIRLSQSSRGPAVKDITADLARDNLAFDEFEVKTLSMKSSEKPISS